MILEARLMSSGGLICFMEEDPKIPMGSVVEFMGHRWWIYSGEVERSNDPQIPDQIVYSGQALGTGDVINLDAVGKR